jgi:hypothetical protein
MSAPVEPCAHCGGSGTVSANENFLLARLHAAAAHDYRWIGSSSDALVAAAMTGAPPKDRPFDGWDLGRCMVTRAVAPAHLHPRMDAIIEDWIATLDIDKQFYGVDEARKMVVEHADDVRLQVEAVSRSPRVSP